jgi:hypothetical protein
VSVSVAEGLLPERPVSACHRVRTHRQRLRRYCTQFYYTVLVAAGRLKNV